MPHSFKGRNKTVWRVIWDRVSHPSLALCRATGDEKGALAGLSPKHCNVEDFLLVCCSEWTEKKTSILKLDVCNRCRHWHFKIVCIHLFTLRFVCFTVSWDRISLCIPGWPQLWDPLVSASQTLGLSVWATLPLNCKCTHKQIEKRPGKIAKSNKSKNTQPQGWQVGKSIYHTNPI